MCLVQAQVNVSLIIGDIMAISEVDSVLEVSFMLVLGWFDPRLTFTNLNPDPNFNTLTEIERNMIWKPTIEFTNTKYRDRSIIDEEVVAKVVRYGNKTESKDIPIYNTDYYIGKENQVQFSR